ncbi:MAG: sensor histidine kinase, partial [Ignavibacteriaceae bacterium]
RLDGVIIDVTVLPNPIVFQNDNAVQLVIKDITERKEAEEVIKKYSKELEESNASKDRFFSIISHDLRSPFQGLLGLTTIATEEFDELTVDELKEFLSNINHSAKSLFNLIENLLQWSRIQRGKIEVKLAQIDLYYDVQYNINLLQPNANTKGLRIVNEVDKTIEVLADTTAFNSVLQNLISNAIKFTKSGGEIKIISEVNNGFAELTVTDNGIGIPEDILPDLFRIDSQHSTLGTEKESGTGLGLIICKELVEMQGGKIWVKSKVDEGTSFTFTLQIP